MEEEGAVKCAIHLHQWTLDRRLGEGSLVVLGLHEGVHLGTLLVGATPIRGHNKGCDR